MQPILATLFPSAVSVAGGRPETMSGALFPEEERLIAGSVAKRRREFTAGRLCARQALAALGVAASPILAHDRRPLWPSGTIGSITHARDRCGAAVALAEDVAGIGLDVEVLGAVTGELQRHVLTAPERDWLASLPEAVQARWATATFSAKEAFYKSLAELAVGFVDFHDVRIRHGTNGTFEIVVEAPALAAKLRDLVTTGRSRVEERWIWTAVTLQRKG
jgi:4'-phosphopantetheinyl transferase EntD